jgi:hypothetical protein
MEVNSEHKMMRSMEVNSEHKMMRAELGVEHCGLYEAEEEDAEQDYYH